MAIDKAIDSTALDNGLTTVADAIRAKGGTSAQFAFPNGMAQAIADLPSGGITPTGSTTLTEENTYDVTNKATAVVDFSATRANLAEAVTAKGVDTLPDSSFDTIANHISLIEGGGGSLPPGITKQASGSFTLDVDTASSNYYIQHNLGAMPKFVVVWSEDLTARQVEANRYIYLITYHDIRMENAENKFWYGYSNSYYRTQTASLGVASSSYNETTNLKQSDYITPTTFRINRSADYYKAGCTYKWIAIA